MAPEDKDHKSGKRAEALFEEFLEKQEAEGLAFDAFLKQHEAHAQALRALHSIHQEKGASGVSDEPLETDDAGRLVRKLDASGGDLLAGDSVDDFKILSLLGEGGFGMVYRAEQEKPLKRDVALKILKPGMDSREIIARFEAERQALALMNHPAIARVYQAGLTHQGRPYFAMEYVAGVPVTAYCNTHQLSLDQRLDLFMSVCDGIQHAHQKAVIHRDIKPSNVLVTLSGGDPQPKIIDFGVAKATTRRLTEKTFFTEIGQLIGTPAYMSPEQAEMTGLDIDTRSDIYSLGVLLYELVTGLMPFAPETYHSASYADIQKRIREEDPPKPSTRLSRETKAGTEKEQAGKGALSISPRELRGDLDWVVMKAMAKDRTHRYAAASELAADIRRHLNHEPVLAGPPGLVYVLKKLVKKYRKAVGFSLMGMLLVTAFLSAMKIKSESFYRGCIRSIRKEISERNLTGARTTCSVLLENYAGREEVRQLEAEVRALEEAVLSEKSAQFLRDAEKDWAEYLEKQQALKKLEDQWDDMRLAMPFWEPPWERKDEFAVFDDAAALRKAMGDIYNRSIFNFKRAVDVAPAGGRAAEAAKKAFAGLYKQLHAKAIMAGDLRFGPEFFKAQGENLYPPLFADKGGTVTFNVSPPKSEVHCFRYEEIQEEKRMFPYPFNVKTQKRSREGLPLRIASVKEAGALPFEAGDVLLALSGKPLGSLGDLVEALEGVPLDGEVEVRLDRGDQGKVEKKWTPFPARLYQDADATHLKPGKLTNPWAQFGFSFEANPLLLGPENCLEGRDGTFTVALPEGSYLFVVKSAGHAGMRFPIKVSGRDEAFSLKLVKEEDVPPGFVPISGGSFLCGGDPEAFQSMKRAIRHVDGFFIGRYEITFAAYLPFIQALDKSGEDAASLVKYIPRTDKGTLLMQKDGDSWQLHAAIRSGKWPVFGVSQVAAKRYAEWRTKNDARWKYRLPTDLEWEKAARGVDGRFFVWGNYPVWSYSWTYLGIFTKRAGAEVIGISPFDESVYGVRDMTGSVSEHAVGQPSPPWPYQSLRGGNFHNSDDYWGRIATRNGRPPGRTGINTGFRLAAEMKT